MNIVNYAMSLGMTLMIVSAGSGVVATKDLCIIMTRSVANNANASTHTINSIAVSALNVTDVNTQI